MMLNIFRIVRKKNIIKLRNLNLQEYQCKQILSDNGLEIQRFGVASDVASAEIVAKKIDASEYVVKAQILAGGRGKGTFATGFKGGVHLTKNRKEVTTLAQNMLGNYLITKQTPSNGVLVKCISIGEALDIENETYVAIMLDPTLGTPVIIGSPCGGMDIEEVARTSPEKIFKEPIDVFIGPTDFQCISMAQKLQFPKKYEKEAADQIKNLYKLLVKLDATQVEINPFGVGSNNKVVCFDSKISFDDNAEFRQKKIFEMNDTSETPPTELLASNAGLTYIQMDGDIGCLVNGAGLAMATMDIVKLYGGSPSNFLDLGGTADVERVTTALTVFSHDIRVSKILINVFGGIVDCRIIAEGVVSAKKSIPNLQPIVMRIKGNNFEAAKKIIESCGDRDIELIDDLEVAAKTVVLKKGKIPVI